MERPEYREWKPYTTKFSPGEYGRGMEMYLMFAGLTEKDLTGKTVLDIGSGPIEKFAKELKAAVPSVKVFSINPDYAEDLDLRINIQDRWPEIEHNDQIERENRGSIAAIGQDLPFADEFADYIFAIVSTSHYSDPEKYPEAAKAWSSEDFRVLKKGGQITYFNNVKKGETYEDFLRDVKKLHEFLLSQGFNAQLVYRDDKEGGKNIPVVIVKK
jgi:SAM-dependent methyltransferase